MRQRNFGSQISIAKGVVRRPVRAPATNSISPIRHPHRAAFAFNPKTATSHTLDTIPASTPPSALGIHRRALDLWGQHGGGFATGLSSLRLP